MGNDADMMTGTTDARRYSIGELAELTGVSRRTVHFYVQRRLIDPPLGLGRGRHYDERHVDQIRRVRELQRRGVPLDAMAAGGLARSAAAASPEGGRLPTPSPALTPVVRIRIDENVTVDVVQTAATPELIADLTSGVSATMSKHHGAGAEPAQDQRGAGAEPAPSTSPGPGTTRSEPEDEEEP